MEKDNTFSRRDFIGAVAAVGAVGLSACATNSQQTSRLWATDRTSGKLPPRGEFVVRNAYVVTMDPKLADIPIGDVHVRNGALVAVGPNLKAPGAEEIDGRNRIACPGFVDTHFHLWGSFARGVVADGDFDYFPVMSRLGPVMTPDDAYNSVKLGIAEAVNSGLTTIHDWSHNIISGAYADADLRALRDIGIRARFSYGYSRNLQQKPKETADFNDIARVKREWFGPSNEGLLTMGFASRAPAIRHRRFTVRNGNSLAAWDYRSRSTPAVPSPRSRDFAASRCSIKISYSARMSSSFILTAPRRKSAA